MQADLLQLRRQRDQIVQEIDAIDRLRRGSLSEQFFHRKRDGRKIRLGPYFVLQCSLKGAKCSERIDAEKAEQTKSDVAHYQRFKQWADQFVAVTDQITRLESGSAESKKNSRSRKSPRNSSPNPEPS